MLFYRSKLLPGGCGGAGTSDGRAGFDNFDVVVRVRDDVADFIQYGSLIRRGSIPQITYSVWGQLEIISKKNVCS
jgi:hypothetical protein